jgi:hypothetical protein
VSAEQLCGVKVMSAGAVEAVKVITGSSRFVPDGEEATVAHAAQELRDAFVSSTRGDGEICGAFASGSAAPQVEIGWELVGSAPAGQPASKFTLLRMGEQTLAAPDSGIVRFACRSEKLAGASPAHIAITAEYDGVAPEPEDDKRAKALMDAYVTVAHSVALAMAEELSCENNAGLPETPDLTPK